MTQLFTQAQVQTMAREEGWSVDDAKIIAAIAMVESSVSVNGRSYADADKEGDQSLVNETYGYSYGLTQVRSMKNQLGTGGPRDATRLKDPRFNLRSALVIKKTGTFKAWSTYNSGQYRAYLPQLFPPPKGVHIVIGGDTLSGIAAQYTGFSWQQMAKVNGLVSPYTIYIGQPLKLPVWDYVVAAGETLAWIAMTYAKVSWQDLAAYNHLVDPNKLTVGQSLRIPDPVVLGKA